MPGSLSLGTSPNAAKEAVCMESRVRMMSSGYVKTTEVMPATPPQNNLSRGGHDRAWLFLEELLEQRQGIRHDAQQDVDEGRT